MPFPYEEWDRTIITKRDETGEYGEEPNKRPIKTLLKYGIINIDKPSGPTSHMVAAYAKDILGVKKAGHSGTLDPKVTGVLVTAIEDGSRIVQALLPAGKEYVALMHLHKECPEKRIREVFEKFTGEITQLPPVKSAVKRVYRKRSIYYLDILEIQGQDILFIVGCQAGTYIRKLCFDMGKKLKVGAHMFELRRTRVANFDETTAVSLLDLKDAYHYYQEGNDKPIKQMIMPVERAIEHLPKIWARDSAIESLSNGRNLAEPGVAKFEACITGAKPVAILTLKGELIALGEALMDAKTLTEAKKGIVAITNKVFIGQAQQSTVYSLQSGEKKEAKKSKVQSPKSKEFSQN